MNDKIVLTADSTLMSDYHRNEFLGFGTCAPSNFIPDFLYEQLFFPAIKTIGGAPVEAPYGLRKIEAQLVKEGFNVSTVAPDHLKSHVKEAKVLGITVMDPFGLGPASSTLATIMKKEPFLARHFRNLLGSSEIREAKERGLKIIVGGPGVWQMHYRPNFVKNYGIDCIIEGEAENVVGKIFKAAVNGEELPADYQTSVRETPSLEEIPEIVGPSINGLVEIGRGCCRGCSFCSVTVRPLRWFPIEKILREMRVNRRVKNGGVILHQDDVMLYGSKNTLPNDEKLLSLHEAVLEKCNSISWSHCSLAAVASKPKLLAEIAEMIRQKQPWWGAEIGLETGSPELAKKIMPAKAHPFKPEDWPEVVRTGMGLMHDNMLVPACTLIVGVPEETESDLVKTIELMDDLKPFRSFIVPLFFVPMGRLKDEDWFKNTHMTKLHEELLTKCVEHDMYWLGNLINMGFSSNWRERAIRPFFKLFASIAKYRMMQAGVRVKA
ncbi:MAG: radical SAM protein [Candidatus Bathyarchaeia archaeon]